MPKTTLSRTGDVALTFDGELLAEEDSQGTNGPTETRWFVLAIYRTTSGKYVGSIAYESRWQGELPQRFAVVLTDPAAVREWFIRFDPCTHRSGRVSPPTSAMLNDGTATTGTRLPPLTVPPSRGCWKPRSSRRWSNNYFLHYVITGLTSVITECIV